MINIHSFYLMCNESDIGINLQVTHSGGKYHHYRHNKPQLTW